MRAENALVAWVHDVKLTPMTVDRQRILEVLERAKQLLEGDWLLLGGGYVALMLDERRTTEDIDLVALSGSNEQRLSLMDLANAAGLPVEAVNTAADYFVRKIADWRDQVELLETGARCRIFAPKPTLFFLLKLGRLSQIDYEDCLGLIRKRGAEIDRSRVLNEITALLPQAGPDKADRLRSLRAALGGS